MLERRMTDSEERARFRALVWDELDDVAADYHHGSQSLDLDDVADRIVLAAYQARGGEGWPRRIPYVNGQTLVVYGPEGCEHVGCTPGQHMHMEGCGSPESAAKGGQDNE
jgi:hypothetical protein